MPTIVDSAGRVVARLPYGNQGGMQFRTLGSLAGMPRPYGMPQREEQSRRAREYALKHLARLRAVQEFLPPEIQQMAGVGGVLMEEHDPMAAWQKAAQAFTRFSDRQGQSNPDELLRQLLLRAVGPMGM